MTKKAKNGFTIIEVVLVLAIAGLIFLMVFVAIPSLQSSQRDTRRKQDIGQTATAITNWIANGNAPAPTVGRCKPSESNLSTGNTCNIIRYYLNGNITQDAASSIAASQNEFKDPDGEYYKLTLFPNTNNIADKNKNAFQMKGTGDNDSGLGTHAIVVVFNAQCDSSESNYKIKAINGQNYFAIRYVLESGDIYCVDNQ